MEWERYLIDNLFSILSFVISSILTIVIFVLEKRRDDKQAKQTEDFNSWMKDQTVRVAAMLETLGRLVGGMGSITRNEAREMVTKIQQLFPSGVQIDDITVNKPYLRIAQAFMGGEVYIQASAEGTKGEQLRSEISKLKEGKLVKYVDPKNVLYTAQIKSIEIEDIREDEKHFYHFRLSLQIVR